MKSTRAKPVILDPSSQVGKRLRRALYFHREAIAQLPAALQSVVASCTAVVGLSDAAFDVIRVADRSESVGFLAYPGFFDAAFPRLHRSWVVSTRTGRWAKRDYPLESNPPVLHRKELLLPPDHPRREEFAALTRAAEEAGLFDDPSVIGHLVQWEETLRAKGLAVQGHRLVPRDSVPDVDDTVERVLRHRTALRRNALSTPMQALLRYGFLKTEHTVFDYGCGHGDDVAELRARGLTARGWDPHFAATEERVPAQVVNLGFVLNVIEDPRERRDALTTAFGLAEKVLVVAVLIGGRTAYERYRLYSDGVLTTRGTFQKYFTQEELRDYLSECLERDPIAVAPGMFFVFKNDTDEQGFLADRQRLARQWSYVSARHTVARERVTTPRAPRAVRQSKWEQHRALLDDFWQRCLDLGRAPEDDEVEGLTELQTFGRPATVLRRLTAEKGADALERARGGRTEDILVFLAQNLFERRKSFSSLPARLQRDIKTFLGSYGDALAAAKDLLFSVGRPENIKTACARAASDGLGYLDDDGNLQLHSSLVPRLPALLRVYVGCAARLYGGIENADVVKIHIESGKLTLTLYDDFEGKALPELIERVKIDMRRQDIRFFEYGPPQGERQFMYLKSRCMAADMDGFAEQRQFDGKLTGLDGLSFAGYGLPGDVFLAELQRRRLRVEGFDLVPERAK